MVMPSGCLRNLPHRLLECSSGGSHQRIERFPVRQQHQPQSSHNPKAGPAIGQNVFAIGFENE